MASNINPSLEPTKSLVNFRFWCQKVLPLVYDDSLSYYEVLGKMVVQLNDVIDNVNADTENVLTLKDAFLELQTYVNNFFDDIDQLASYAERAETAQTAANRSAINASESAANASASSLTAMNARDAANSARQAAETSANTASTAADHANTKANEAAQSAITAQTAQASASQSATLAATDRSAAQTAANTATTKASEASTSATNAAQSETNAEELVNNIQENLDNIQQNTQDINELKESFAQKVQYPVGYKDISITEVMGIVDRRNLSIFSTGDSYMGRHVIINVQAGEKYKVTCTSNNSNYPACFGVEQNGTSGFIPSFLAGSNTQYVDADVTIPDGVVQMYINGFADAIAVKKQFTVNQNEFQQEYNKISTTPKANLLCKVDSSGKLYFKKKSLNTGKDLLIKMGQSPIGNNLFTFLSVSYQNNLGELTNNFITESGQPLLDMTQTDWFSPYKVKAITNGDGDHPTDDYYTGGNHLSNNNSSGGGKTATQTDLEILVDGLTPTTNTIYSCSAIDVFVTNQINGYNTSKDDGTGRNILQEKIHIHITPEEVLINNCFTALEEILVETFFGLSTYYPSATVRFIGGNTRTPFTISSNLATLNKTTRDIIVAGNLEIEMGIYSTDLGSFNYSPESSFFTSGNKAYSNLIKNNATNFNEDEEYCFKGYYKFN